MKNVFTTRIVDCGVSPEFYWKASAQTRKYNTFSQGLFEIKQNVQKAKRISYSVSCCCENVLKMRGKSDTSGQARLKNDQGKSYNDQTNGKIERQIIVY